uniref:Uncharacterized protein n=1 Tax=Mycena chlorophos TaxID=658473 RepID=A0ABQ0KYT4_MYCCL|nr:predicted protein [Mycena chlorophos]
MASVHGYSEDEESPILQEFVNDTIARERRNPPSPPSPRTELLSPINSSNGSHRTTRGPSERFRRQREQAYASVPAAQILSLLIEREYECKRLRKGLLKALDRVDAVITSQSANARVTQETLDKFREVNRARVEAERALAKTSEELRLWKFQFEHAQKEIARAQDVVALVETQRDDAEKAAARTRTLARQLKEQKLVGDAMEEGRKLGYKAGFRRAQQEIALRQGVDVDELTVDHEDEERQPEVDGLSLLDAPSIRPTQRAPSTQPSIQPARVPSIQPQRAPTSARSPSIQLSIFPVEIPSASVLNGHTNRPALHVDTQLSAAPPPRPRRRAQAPPVLASAEQLFINRRVSAVPPSPNENDRPRSMQPLPSPQPTRQPSPAPPPPAPKEHHWSQLPPRPMPPPLSPQPSISHMRPPDNYIPSLSPDGDIDLPPPHHLANPLASASPVISPESLGNRTSVYNAPSVATAHSERERQPSRQSARPRSPAGRSVVSVRSAYSYSQNPHIRHASLDSAAAQIAGSSKQYRDQYGQLLGPIREDASMRSGRSGHGRSLRGQDGRRGSAVDLNGSRRSVSMNVGIEPQMRAPSHYQERPSSQYQKQPRRSRPPSQYRDRSPSRPPTEYQEQPQRSRPPSQYRERSPSRPPSQYFAEQPQADLALRPSLRRVKEKRPITPSEIGSPMGTQIYVQPPSSVTGSVRSGNRGHVAANGDKYLSPMSPVPLPIPTPMTTTVDGNQIPKGFVAQTISVTVPAQVTVPVPPPVTFKGKSISSPVGTERPVSAVSIAPAVPVSFPGMQQPPSMNMLSRSPSRSPLPIPVQAAASGSHLNLTRQPSNASMRSNASKYAYDARTYVDPAYYAADTGWADPGALPPRPRSRVSSNASANRSRAGSNASLNTTGRAVPVPLPIPVPGSRAGSHSHSPSRSRADSGASGLEYFGPPGGP